VGLNVKQVAQDLIPEPESAEGEDDTGEGTAVVHQLQVTQRASGYCRSPAVTMVDCNMSEN